MGKFLLVVESPTKMKTISKYIGKDFVVKATNGHIKDLPKSKLGVDVENAFDPQFEVLKGKAKAVAEIKKAGKEADVVYIGSDPDREGEAIAFHVAEVMGKDQEIKRVLFHEITRKGVLEAMGSPTNLDAAKYEAQKARRILDRLVGYRISPLLWEKVKYGLSAGRVQSVALRLVCDREKEVEAFVREEYWVIEADLTLNEGRQFKAYLERRGGEKIRVTSEEMAKGIKGEVTGRDFVIASVEKKEKHVAPQPAFITSRLQQEASRKLKFSPKRTMALAQRLYEGVEMGDEGLTGLITYMRTDSVRVSSEAIGAARGYIEKQFGPAYLPKTPNFYRNRKSAQDAHEAIRPAEVRLTPDKVKPHLERELFLLYELIWKRFISSQMVREKVEATTVDVSAGEYTFVARGVRVLFDGFTRIYEEKADDEEEQPSLPAVKQGEKADLKGIELMQRFTNPPPRYSEASLIRTLELKGIGRPSTYATIVSTIQDRTYVTKDTGRLVPTPLGRTVNDLLVQFFPLIVDIDFTVKMEERLDMIEAGKKTREQSLRTFNDYLEAELANAKVKMRDLKREERETDIICDKCGKAMLLRWGKNGEYILCSGRPACKNKKNVRTLPDGTLEIVKDQVHGTCTECGGDLLEKSGRFGRFLACSNYPECKHTEPFSAGFACPLEGCEGKLVEKVSKKKKRKFFSCSKYPACAFATNFKPIEGPCPQCMAPTLFFYRGMKRCLRDGCSWRSR